MQQGMQCLHAIMPKGAYIMYAQYHSQICLWTKMQHMICEGNGRIIAANLLHISDKGRVQDLLYMIVFKLVK